MVSNSSIPFDCIAGFNATWEFVKFSAQLAYLIPGLLLNIRIVLVIWVSQKAKYSTVPFFHIFAADCLTNSLLILSDGFVLRFFLYTPIFCTNYAYIFYEPSHFLNWTYYISNGARTAKSVTQILISANRMSCVVFPHHHRKLFIWRPFVTIPFIILGGVAPNFNLYLSRIHGIFSYGGFALTYQKSMEWASISTIQFCLMILTLIATFVFTIITIFALLLLRYPVKRNEMSLCVATFIISCGFLCGVMIKYMYMYCQGCRHSDFIYASQFWGYDLLIICSPLVMCIMNSKLRHEVWPVYFRKTRRLKTVQIRSSFAL